MGSHGAQRFGGLWFSDNRLWIPFQIGEYAMATKLFICYLLKFHPRRHWKFTECKRLWIYGNTSVRGEDYEASSMCHLFTSVTQSKLPR